MEIILYTTNCPRCKILEKKLDQKNIKYSVNTSIEEMIEKGFKTAPVLVVDGGDPMDFTKAVVWVNKMEV